MTRNTSINPTIQKIIKLHLKEKGELPSSQYVTRQLEAEHPDLVDAYIKAHKDALIQGQVTRVMTHERNQLRRSQLAERLVSGKSDKVFDLERLWATPYFVPNVGWKSLGNLTGSDHDAIADKYQVAAVAFTSRADFHRELAKKVGSKTTRSVYKPKEVMKKLQLAYDTNAQLTGGTP